MVLQVQVIQVVLGTGGTGDCVDATGWICYESRAMTS